jgi:deazaflavin-dependent oxidoreductase (nitroreductase family)
MSNRSPLERLLLKVLPLHDLIYQKSNGWVGHKLPGMPPNLLLRTVGAKSGQPRISTLTYARDGDAYLIVGSNAGISRNPAWYHNLRKNPECEINVGPKRLGVTARLITPEDADYQRLWQLVNKNNANRYSGYQGRTSRPIPIFALTPG